MDIFDTASQELRAKRIALLLVVSDFIWRDEISRTSRQYFKLRLSDGLFKLSSEF